MYPNGDGARFFGTSTALYPEWVWRYYLSTGDKATALAHYSSTAKVAAWLWSARQAGTGLLYGLGDTSNGDPVYGYDLSVAADTASNVLAVNAFNRVAQLATLADDRGGAALWQARATQLAAAVNAVAAPDATASTWTVSTPTAPRAEPLPRGQRTPARLWRRTGGRREGRRRLRRQPRHRYRTRTTASSCCGRWPQPTCPTPWCTR